MQDVVVRDAVVADIETLCSLRPARRQHEAKLVEAEAGTARFLVAATDADILGFAILFLRHPANGPPKSHIPKLSDCFVNARHRSLGIGRALVTAQERIVRATGCEHLYVSVDPVAAPWWLEFFRRREYLVMQPEPYRKREVHSSDNDGTQEVLAWRQDLVLDLRRGEVTQ